MNNRIAFLTDISCKDTEWIGGFTELEERIILKYIKKPVLHLFCGKSKIGKWRIDIMPKSNANINVNVFDFIKDCNFKFNTLLMDPIFSNEDRQDYWKKEYSKLGINIKDLFIFPYDQKKTNLLMQFIKKKYPEKIIIKSMNHYTIDNYYLLQGFDIYQGFFKPNRCMSIYQAKNNKLKI